jgi:Tfp pilus assembly protein PilN
MSGASVQKKSNKLMLGVVTTFVLGPLILWAGTRINKVDPQEVRIFSLEKKIEESDSERKELQKVINNMAQKQAEMDTNLKYLVKMFDRDYNRGK